MGLMPSSGVLVCPCGTIIDSPQALGVALLRSGEQPLVIHCNQPPVSQRADAHRLSLDEEQMASLAFDLICKYGVPVRHFNDVASGVGMWSSK